MGIPKKHLGQGEHVILSLRTHIKAMIWPITALVLIIVGAVALALTLPLEGQEWVNLVIAVLALALAVWAFLLPFLRWYYTTYTVTNRRLITRAGLLTRTGHDIPLSRINDVQIEKQFFDRIFGCGTLLIANASEYGGVRLHDVPDVEAVQVQINDLLHRAQDPSDESAPPLR